MNKKDNSKLFGIAGAGEESVIAEIGKLFFEMQIQRPQKKVREPGAMKGKIEIAEDFDAQLPDDLQAAFEGR